MTKTTDFAAVRAKIVGARKKSLAPASTKEVQGILRSPEKARELLVKAGIITTKGNLTGKYR